MTPTTSTSGGYGVDARACIRCAACATAAPEHFSVGGTGVARLVRPPATAAERRACASAALLCPTAAVRGAGGEIPAVAAASEVKPDPELYPVLAGVAEGARWSRSSVPWASFDPGRVTPWLLALVREMAFFEQTTFSATQQFMRTFEDDPDFTRWVSVWFYEETRHPEVLLQWLTLAGEKVDPGFVARGRVSAPFLKSRAGTLVMNVISEIVAAHAYLTLAQASPEPLLGTLARSIAADEGRHSASFFRYARRRIEGSASPLRERLDAVKVLHLWLNEGEHVAHPVRQTMEKLAPYRDREDLQMPLDLSIPRKRITEAVGLLVDLPLSTPEDVARALEDLTQQVQARG